MSLIAAYKPYILKLTPTQPTGEGFDPETNKFTPFEDGTDTEAVLDAIAVASEAGVLDRTTWVGALFQTSNVFREFLTYLSEYDDQYRIHDRWHVALMLLANQTEESGFIASQDIADKLFARAVESGQYSE